MTQHPKADPARNPRDAEHAQVLDLIGSPEMQRRLEEAREKRARVLAERAAVAEPSPAQFSGTAGASPSVDAAKADQAPPAGSDEATPAEAPALDVPLPNAPTAQPAAVPPVPKPDVVPDAGQVALPMAKPFVRTPPVLRAPARPVAPEQARASGRRPQTRRRKVEPSSVILGLVLGALTGLGATWVAGVATTPAVPSGGIVTQAEPATSVTVETGSLAPERDLRPRTRPVASAAEAKPAEAAPLPDRQGPVVEVGPATPPPIVIDDLLRSAVRPGTPDPSPDTFAPVTPPADSKAAVPPVSAAESATAPGQGRPQVIVYLPRPYPEASIAALRATLGEAGSDLAGTRTTRFGIPTAEVRYFHPQDAANANRVAQAMGAAARDFSAYRPSPPPGTLEVRLPDRSRGVAVIER